MKKLNVLQMENLQGGRTWRECFENGASSAGGIIGGVVASFWGPAGVAAFYAGGALACL